MLLMSFIYYIIICLWCRKPEMCCCNCSTISCIINWIKYAVRLCYSDRKEIFFTGLTHLRSNWPVCDPQYKMSLACSKSYVCIFMHFFFFRTKSVICLPCSHVCTKWFIYTCMVFLCLVLFRYLDLINLNTAHSSWRGNVSASCKSL